MIFPDNPYYQERIILRNKEGLCPGYLSPNSEQFDFFPTVPKAVAALQDLSWVVLHVNIMRCVCRFF